ncbi:glutamine--fructose-6-phosphate transaminase (isomerizing) [Pseudonocardia phyllosphaerae]|uniref:glutamine--fructose-6-phosphate transaminase (isomerizing) n=1 Tax=Pseudonocardia phyllosphaerae TaxID=3390502 RepID=UPI00397864F0
MCGIVGYVGPREATDILVEGLTRLEYRGYDSAGVALPYRRKVRVRRTPGRVEDLRASLEADPLSGHTGIAHTRWATHGEPSEANAHPQTDSSGRIAVVHNGIIENADELRAKLAAGGVVFTSDTDTEILPHLIAEALDGGAASLTDAVRSALSAVEGTYGLAVLDGHSPDEIVVARNGSPIVLGIGDGEMVVASDLAAVVRHTRQVVYLDDGEVVSVRAGGVEGSTRITPVTLDPADAEDADIRLGGHPDFLAKEIAEQPDAVSRAVAGRLDSRFATTRLDGLKLDPRELRAIRRVVFLGCGSAYYAGQIGADLVEELARIPAHAEPAGEFRYRNPVVDPDALYVAVSQSGETADTLAAVQELQRKGGRVVGAVNVIGSAIARECGAGVFLHSGTEVSVASTKAVTNMAVSFAMLAVLLGRVRDLSLTDGRRIVDGLAALPGLIDAVVADDAAIGEVARRHAQASSMFFVGRTRCWPVAREGAQKLKEISYVHAEAYPAAELKHGPLALVSPAMPSVVLAPGDELLAKNVGTIEQIRARGGPVVAVTDTDLPAGLADDVLRVPRTEPELAPILLTVPLQIFARHVAVALGRDVDRPRNLAKSVTVE